MIRVGASCSPSRGFRVAFWGVSPAGVYLSGGLCCASRCAKAETSLNDRLRRIHHRGRIFPSTPRSKKGPNGLPVTVNETEPDRAKAES
jgi:hypothetical protein